MWLLPPAIYFLLILGNVHHADADCVMRNICHYHSKSAGAPCVVKPTETAPRKIRVPTDVGKKLRSFCPDLFKNLKAPVCCESDQAAALTDQLTQAYSILGRCPSCFHNFAQLWCHFTCSPNQSNFVSVTETAQNNNATTYVLQTEYKVKKSFMDNTFQSCKDVKFSSTPAIQMMCNSRPCTQESWMSFIGTLNVKNNIPIGTDFILMPDNDEDSMNLTAIPCTLPVRQGRPTCSLDDCPVDVEKYIRFKKTDAEKEHCQIYGAGCSTVFLAVVCILLSGVILYVFYKILFNFLTQDVPERVVETGALVEGSLQLFCKNYGEFVATNTNTVLCSSLIILAIALIGLGSANFAQDPSDLWSAPNSLAKLEQLKFRAAFRGTYKVVQSRIETSSPVRSSSYLTGPIFDIEYIREIFRVEQTIRQITSADGKVKFKNICARPMGMDSDCLIMGITNYFDNNIDLLNYMAEERTMSFLDYVNQTTGVISKKNYKSATAEFVEDTSNENTYDDKFDYFENDLSLAKPYEIHIKSCITQPYSINSAAGYSCLGSYGGPAFARYSFGQKQLDYDLSSSATLTVALEPPVTKDDEENIRKWEQSFILAMNAYKSEAKNLSITYMSDESIRQEIENQTRSDMIIFALSAVYIVVFVALGLGKYYVVENNLMSIMVHTKFTVGITGFLCAGFSCLSSVSVISLYGLEPPMNAVLVMAFIVLSVSVNSAFIYVKTYQEVRLKFHTLEYIPTVGMMTEMAMSTCGITASTGVVLFLIGGMTTIPAIRSFSMLSGLALFWQFIFLNTFWLSVLAKDIKREMEGRAEFFLCYQDSEPVNHHVSYYNSVIYDWFKNRLSKFLMKRSVRLAVVGIFIATFSAAGVSTHFVRIGFDQRLAFSRESYLTKHFNHMNDYMDVGPPVYFVFEGEADFHLPEIQNQFCSLPGCDRASIGTLLSFAARRPEETYLDGPVYNWIDAYLQFISRESMCCRLMKHDNKTLCSPEQNAEDCVPCLHNDRADEPVDEDNPIDELRPSEEAFYKYLPVFLDTKPGQMCPHGGKGSYDRAINLNPYGRIKRFHIMTSFKKLRIGESSDFIGAMEVSRLFAKKLSTYAKDRFNVFSYSSFFVYYEQYSTTIFSTVSQLLLSLVVIFIMLVVTLGIDVWCSSIGVITVISAIIHQFGMMPLLGVELNAISQTNMMMSICISLEFIIHVLRDYCHCAAESRIERARYSIYHMGCIVFQGLSQCLFGAIMFLMFCDSRVITTYYCKVLLSTVIISAVHGLIYLTVFLSFRGPLRVNRFRRNITADVELIRSAKTIVYDNWKPRIIAAQAPCIPPRSDESDKLIQGAPQSPEAISNRKPSN